MDVSIIIPTYNRLWSLQKAIDSCKKNNDLKVQIIVVDDGSTDGTWDAISNQPGITALKQQHWGKPWAVNYAFGFAEGKYIKFLDSDDWLLPGILEKQFLLAEKEASDIVVSGYEVHDKEQCLSTLPWINCDDFIAQNLGECDSSHYSAFLFKRDFIKDIPHRTSFAAANFASRDDRCFMLEVALKEPKISVLDRSAFGHLFHDKERLQFRNNSGSTCTNYQHQLIYRNILQQLQESGRLTQRRVKAAIKILWPLCTWIAKDNLDEALDLLQWIKTIDPDFKINEPGTIGKMYNTLGFKKTQKILALRRLLKYGIN